MAGGHFQAEFVFPRRDNNKDVEFKLTGHVYLDVNGRYHMSWHGVLAHGDHPDEEFSASILVGSELSEAEPKPLLGVWVGKNSITGNPDMGYFMIDTNPEGNTKDPPDNKTMKEKLDTCQYAKMLGELKLELPND